MSTRDNRPTAAERLDGFPATGPVLTRQQVREVDRLAIEALGIPGMVLMENAGLNATRRLLMWLGERHGLDPGAVRAAILCGGGNNGGDGYVIARQLHNRGASVRVFALKDPDDLTGDAAVNHAICARMGLPIERVGDEAAARQMAQGWSDVQVVVDALLGTGFRGEVREPMASAIEAVNAWRQGDGAANRKAGRTVLAVDIPSGLDCDGGGPSNATVRADLTVTFVAVKSGFATEAARPWLGEVAVADIGAPPEMVRRVTEQAAGRGGDGEDAQRGRS